MAYNTTFKNREEFQNQLIRAIDKFESIYSKSEIVLHENLYPLKKDSYHFVGQLLKRLEKANRTETIFASHVFRAIYRAEVFSANSAHIALAFALEFATQLARGNIFLANETESMRDFEDFMDELKNNFQSFSKASKPSDVREAINRSCHGSTLLSEVVWQAVQLGGLEGRLFVENGRQSNYVIELKEGYSFKLKPFKWMLSNNVWERKECKVLVIDGLVEKVSEIDHLLTRSFETKQPMAIIALGFSEEVAATLKANMDRELLDIQPIRVHTDLESLNLTNDIAVVCGTTPVSSVKGDLITFIKYDEIPVVDKFHLTETQCIVENKIVFMRTYKTLLMVGFVLWFQMLLIYSCQICQRPKTMLKEYKSIWHYDNVKPF
jgi:hypothetical protein